MKATTILPPVPEAVPVVTGTSYSEPVDLSAHAGEWRCEAVRRPRQRDAFASVYAPGGDAYLIAVSLPADDLDDAEATGRYAVDVARQLVRLVNSCDDREALDALKALIGSDGPMGGKSRRAWLRVREWLPEVRTADGVQNAPPLTL